MATSHEVFANENRVIERQMTDEEVAAIASEHKANQDAKKANEKAASERAKLKSALLERLGITADEAALLLS